MTQTIELKTILETITCYKCGITFAVPEHFKQKRLEDGASFWCPNGHGQCYSEPLQNKLKALQDKIASQQNTIRSWADDYSNLYDQKKTVERRLCATRGVVTRIHNRITKGMCPVCRRHFPSLQNHMHTQHPDWQPDPNPEDAIP